MGENLIYRYKSSGKRWMIGPIQEVETKGYGIMTKAGELSDEEYEWQGTDGTGDINGVNLECLNHDKGTLEYLINLLHKLLMF